ncbi:uncharacterized protein EMH_0092450 [Eimeria mitis]|uniref:Uncharacterized protein n=1 Tax=Eimeria mitis TaxID=44415 RepID=U6KIK7_9EIME|nr:uncharacterized protein EMH_0092450 [Eimeria mitis]CDJ36636.1 hypothetical protein EMH_0092450 [Eimeria mitis]
MESTSAASTSAGFTAIHSDLAGRVYSGVPHGDGGHEIAWPSSQMRAEQQLEQPEDGFEVTLDAVAKSESAAAARAGSDGSAEPSYPGNIHLHPFVRLPEVNPKDIHGVFRKEFALAPYFGRFSPMDSYMTLRRLFAKASLTAKDIGTLIKEAEILANYATERLASPCSKCTASYLVRKLSSLLMVFDHLVCALELLGDKMDAQSWWAEFVRKFHTDYHLPEAGRTRRARFLSRLVNRLSSALSVYKEGRRPALGEVIDLKRAIIAEANAEGQLTNPLWELWMDDDKAFFSSSSDSERPSDV